ncbi:MAG: hypothetical protein AAGM67_01030, partial [Bacteroidota bacterium]
MPQDPLKVDAIQIEEASGAILTIDRDSSDDSLRFIDGPNPSGINLSDLSGLRSIGNVTVVGTSGSGAEFTDLQAALDAVPATASMLAPEVILVCTGTYTGPISWTKDGIVLVALGRVVLTSSSTAATLDIQAGATTTPRFGVIHGFTIQNTGVGGTCVRATGSSASTLGADGFGILNTDLEALGVGGFQLQATAMNQLFLRGGSWDNSVGTSSFSVSQLADFRMSDIEGVYAGLLEYSNTGTIPSDPASDYLIHTVEMSGNLLSNLDGVGSLDLSHSKV